MKWNYKSCIYIRRLYTSPNCQTKLKYLYQYPINSTFYEKPNKYILYSSLFEVYNTQKDF